MARDSQGLHIFLIVSVMLNLVLAVTTFLFVKQSQKEAARAADFQKQAEDQRTTAENTLKDNNQLKKWLGEPQDAKLETISEDFDKDMETYAVGYTEENRDYRSVLQWLAGQNEKLHGSWTAAEAALKQLQQDHLATKQKLIADQTQEKQRADQKATELTEEQQKYTQSLQTARTEAEDEFTKLTDSTKNQQATIDALNGQVAKLQDQNKTLQADLLAERKKNEELRKPTYELADGKIRWVNQGDRTVYIDLGRADALPRLMTFAVYPADAYDISRAGGGKASVEVTRIISDHLAEARIVDDDPADPIMSGDLINTLLWSPGEREHFALTSGQDIDDDGKSDVQRVINIITANGGVVDYHTDDTVPEDPKEVGQFTGNTRYLVEGNEPAADAALAKLREIWTKVDKEAESRALTKISLKQLLNKMGYKRETRVVRFGPGANPADFRPKPPEGVPKVSSGTVSGLYTKERPTTGTGHKSAY
jgi:hypothetical protein